MLKKKYGKIINITSIVGHTGNVGQVITLLLGCYCSFSKSLSLEYAKKISILIVFLRFYKDRDDR